MSTVHERLRRDGVADDSAREEADLIPVEEAQAR